jgi:hypothetical protein
MRFVNEMLDRRFSCNHNEPMTQYEIESLWVKDALDVEFNFGDIVRVNSGANVDVEGRIVAVIALDPCPTYVIELPSGSSVVATEPNLALVSRAEPGKHVLILHGPEG